MCRILQVFEKLVLQDVSKFEDVHFKTHFNLTLHQSHLLRDLADDSSIVIKLTDKGGGIVILDSTTYKEEALRQLNDVSSYKKIPSDPTCSILNLVRIMVHKALSLDYITKDLADILIVEHPGVPLFYLLLKIHKPGFPPRGWLIVSAQDSILKNTLKFVDHLLQPHVKTISTYLQDTRDFILKIEHMAIPGNSGLATLDVTSLYTRIPHHDIRNTVQLVLEKDDLLGYPIHFILDLVNLLCEKNYFRSKQDFYFQIRGVTMGSAFAPSVANLFMSHLEINFILNPVVNPFFQYIFKFFRFIDDCFCIYTDPDSLPEFGTWINGIHPTISFTSDSSTTNINFLDTSLSHYFGCTSVCQKDRHEHVLTFQIISPTSPEV